MNHIQILFFASLRERAGIQKAEIEIPPIYNIADLKISLVGRFPGLAMGMHSTLVSINHEFAFDEDQIPENAEVAFFPPVSGGAGVPTLIEITDRELDLNHLVAKITLETTGATCLFTGIVRGVTNRGEPHETTRLEYEAYQPMAAMKMKQVAEEIRQRWPDVEGIAIVQRVGMLAPLTPTVLIACSAAHRDSGVFEAARYGIDRLKEIVPIWKKEIGKKGEEWVEGEYQPTRED